MTQNVHEESFIKEPCHAAIEYAADAIAKCSIAIMMGGATRNAVLEIAVVSLGRALREVKSAQREAKKFNLMSQR